MKKIFLITLIISFVGLVLLGCTIWFNTPAISKAQTSESNSDYQKLLDRDKNISKEKVEKAFSEAEKIQNDILSVITNKKTEFKIHHMLATHLRYDRPGRRGETYNEMTWRTKSTQLSVHFELGLKKEEQIPAFRKSLDGIAMGEFFKVPNIGDEAVLVKNVSFNTKTTDVGLHFVKGRAQVDVYITNYKRKTEKNEKELMEIVNLIEPLIIARDNFDD